MIMKYYKIYKIYVSDKFDMYCIQILEAFKETQI
jgi:hypothetical protein